MNIVMNLININLEEKKNNNNNNISHVKVTANVPGLVFPKQKRFLPKERSLLKLTYSEKKEIKSQIARELLRK